MNISLMVVSVPRNSNQVHIVGNRLTIAENHGLPPQAFHLFAPTGPPQLAHPPPQLPIFEHLAALIRYGADSVRAQQHHVTRLQAQTPRLVLNEVSLTEQAQRSAGQRDLVESPLGGSRDEGGRKARLPDRSPPLS